MRYLAVILCLLASQVYAGSLSPGERTPADFACITSADALEVGVSIDRDASPLKVIYEKLISGACFSVPPSLERIDATLVKVTDTAEDTDVWEIIHDNGRTLYVARERNKGDPL